MDTKAALRVLTGLAQESRLAVVRYLVEHGSIGAYAGQLAEDLGCSPGTLSFHLKELNHSGLVQAHHEGRYIRYVVDVEVINGLMDYLTHNCCGGRKACFPETKAAKPAATRTKAVKPAVAPARRAAAARKRAV